MFRALTVVIVAAFVAGCGNSNNKTELPTTSAPKPIASDSSTGVGKAPPVKSGMTKD